MSGGNIQTRFAHLLQPIRDLTKNWDIDVAAELEEYLTELEEITIAFEGSESNMNFAEAALVIQGSACVYSRKVEYLYALVYQTLDLIASKKRSGQPSSVDEQGRDSDTSFAQGQRENHFLTLDDLQEATNINMIERQQLQATLQTTTVPRTPMSLMPLHESEKLTSTPLYSQNGELLGNKTDYKLNAGTLGRNGALLLEPTNHFINENPINRHGDCIGQGRLSFITEAQPSLLAQPCTSEWATVDGGPMEVGNEIGDICCHDNSFGDVPPPFSPDTSRDSMRRSRRLRSRVQLEEDKVKRKEPRGWSLLDPHEVSESENKPFKRGITQKLPRSLQLPKTRKRKKSDSSPSSPSQSLADFLFQSFYSCSSQFPKNSMTAPSSSEFEAHYWKEQKRRKADRAKMMAKIKMRHGSDGIIEEREEELEELQEHEQQPYIPLGEEDQAVITEQAFTVFDRQETDVFEGAEPMALDNSLSEASVDSAHLPPVVQSYEDLVRHYIESTLAAAVTYATETDLSTRVKEWEEKIKPRLQAEEKRPVFDIRCYGNQIIETLQERSQTDVPFQELVHGMDQLEICRTFTASLQLANDSNIEINTHGSNEMDAVFLKLLSSDLPHRDLSNYRVPSLQEQSSSSNTAATANKRPHHSDEDTQENSTATKKRTAAKKKKN